MFSILIGVENGLDWKSLHSGEDENRINRKKEVIDYKQQLNESLSKIAHSSAHECCRFKRRDIFIAIAIFLAVIVIALCVYFGFYKTGKNTNKYFDLIQIDYSIYIPPIYHL